MCWRTSRRSFSSARSGTRSVVHARVALELARDREPDLLRDPLGLGAALAGSPDRCRLVAIAEHAAVPGLVLAIDDRIAIREPELVAQQIDFGRLAGQEQPARVGHAV